MEQTKVNFYYYGAQPPHKELIHQLEQFHPIIACDVETPSLKDRRLLGIGMAFSSSDAFYLPLDSQYIDIVKRVLVNPHVVKVFHNGSFDLAVIEKWLGVTVVNVTDTIVEARLLGLDPALADLALDLLGEAKPPITDLIGKGVKAITMDMVPEKDVAKRCCEDVQVTWRVHEKIWDDVPKQALDLELKLFPLVSRIRERGMYIDQTQLICTMDSVWNNVDWYYSICESQGFNPGSSKQFGEFLESRGHTVHTDAVTGNYKLAEEDIKEFYLHDVYAQVVLAYRHWSHQLSWLKNVNVKYLAEDGRIHPTLKQGGAVTGRFASTDPNSQNIEPILRNILSVGKGKKAVARDFSQIELRTMAYLSQDPTMVAIYRDTSRSLHDEVAIQFNMDKRDAKTVNFGVAYGGNEYTLWRNNQIPMEQGKQFLANHRSMFPVLWEWINHEQMEIMRKGYVETMMGRRRYLPGLNSSDARERKKAVREGFNMIAQGSAAEFLKGGMIKYSNEEMINLIHDEYYFEADEGHVVPSLQDVAPFNTPMSYSIGDNFGKFSKKNVRGLVETK